MGAIEGIATPELVQNGHLALRGHLVNGAGARLIEIQGAVEIAVPALGNVNWSSTF